MQVALSHPEGAVLSIANVTVVAAEPARSRKVLIDTTGLPLAGEVDSYTGGAVTDRGLVAVTTSLQPSDATA